MTTEDALLQDILANPQDNTPRLILADWLEEHGGAAGRDRAEFVRVQVELAKVHDRLHDLSRDKEVQPGDYDRWAELRRRESELKSRIPETILTLPTYDEGKVKFAAVFRRGFVAEVTLPCLDWLRHGPQIVRAAPVEKVSLSDKEPILFPYFGTSGLCYFGWQLTDAYEDDMNRIPRILGEKIPEVLEDVINPYERAIAGLSHGCLRYARETSPEDARLLWGNLVAGQSQCRVRMEYSRDGKTWHPSR